MFFDEVLTSFHHCWVKGVDFWDKIWVKFDGVVNRDDGEGVGHGFSQRRHL